MNVEIFNNADKINVEDLIAEMSTTRVKAAGAPTGYTTTQEGDTGTIETPAMLGEVDSFDRILKEAGFDPEVFTLASTPRIKTWDAQTPDGVMRLYSYQLDVVKKTGGINTDDLIAHIHKPTLPSQRLPEGPRTGVLAVGDLQLGKSDGDGTQGIVGRYKQAVHNAHAEWEKNPTDTILIAFLGDCIEGIVSQGGRNINNNDLTLTEQLRTLRHLMTHTIQTFHKRGVALHVASVPGNHDETHRTPVSSRPDDSYAVDSLRAVEEAHNLAGTGDTINWHYPEPNRLHITLKAGDHEFILAHGHQWRKGKHFDWWKGFAFTNPDANTATYMLAGHNHHLHVDTSSHRYFIQVPALEKESAWWYNKTGETGNPGAVWMVPGVRGPQQLTLV